MAIWWFGAITASVFSLLGTVICIGLAGDYALRRIGWARPLILWWIERTKRNTTSHDHCNCQRYPFANDCPLHGEIEHD